MSEGAGEPVYGDEDWELLYSVGNQAAGSFGSKVIALISIDRS